MRFTCPECGSSGNASPEMVGKRGKCPKCKAVFLVKADVEEAVPPTSLELNPMPDNPDNERDKKLDAVVTWKNQVHGGLITATGILGVLLLAALSCFWYVMMDVKADIGSLGDELGRRIDGIGKRMDAVEKRIDGVVSRIDGVGTRIDKLESRIGDVDARVGGLAVTLAGVKGQVDLLDIPKLNRLTTKVAPDLGFEGSLVILSSPYSSYRVRLEDGREALRVRACGGVVLTNNEMGTFTKWMLHPHIDIPLEKGESAPKSKDAIADAKKRLDRLIGASFDKILDRVEHRQISELVEGEKDRPDTVLLETIQLTTIQEISESLDDFKHDTIRSPQDLSPSTPSQALLAAHFLAGDFPCIADPQEINDPVVDPAEPAPVIGTKPRKSVLVY